MRTLRGRYRLETLLGAGGMAEVWRAHDLVLGRPVAVKLLTPRLADRASREHIRAEARVAARLSHPNVASVYDFGVSLRGPTTRVPYIVMELVDGPTLASRLHDGPLHWRTAVRVVAEVAAALAAAHAGGVVHRDVKPANIILARNGVKVVDFGIAAAVGALEDKQGIVLGTPAYLAPERLGGEAAAPATDVYALGVILYRCLGGTLPWPARTITEMITAHRDQPPAPLPRVDGLPDDVVDLCQQCLSKAPDQRPTSFYAALVLAEAAGVVVALPPVAEPELSPVEPPPAAQPAAGFEPTAATRTTLPVEAAPAPAPSPGPAASSSGPAAPGARRRALTAARVTGLALAAVVTTAQLWPTSGSEPHHAEAGNPPPGHCAARYVAEHSSAGSFTAELDVTNTGGQILDRWSVAFALPAGQRVTGAEGATWHQVGEAVTLVGEDPIAAGHTIRLSVTGTYGGPAAPPNGFTLAGVPCERTSFDVRSGGGPANGGPAPDAQERRPAGTPSKGAGASQTPSQPAPSTPAPTDPPPSGEPTTSPVPVPSLPLPSAADLPVSRIRVEHRAFG